MADTFAALKKKHSKTGEDAKFHGTILGRGNDTGEVQVEGGPDTTIAEWISKRTVDPEEEENKQQEAAPQQNGHISDDDDDSGLSSVGDRLDGDEGMDLS